MSYFVNGETQFTSLKRKTHIRCDKTLVNWLSYCKEVCSLYFETFPALLGGLDKIVEVDEAVLVKRKYNRGRRVREQWCFALRDVETKNCVVIVVPDRRKETLIPLIQNYVFIRSIIYTDGAKVYDCLTEIGYKHAKCIHSIGEFVNIQNNNILNLFSGGKQEAP